jgi:peptidoglycan lytic transglycosylase G
MHSPLQYYSNMHSNVSASRMLRRALGAATLAFVAACGGNGPSVRVTIPPGASMRVAADSLAKAGVVRGSRVFRLYASLTRSDRDIRAGTYLLHKNSSWGSVLEALRSGKGLVRIITIPEGFSLSQIEPLIATKLGQPRDSVEAATRDTALLHQLKVPTPTLEGYLFPDTYIFPENTTARVAVSAMVRRYEQIWKPAWTARLDTIKMSRNEVMSLAAIVEKEAKVAQERPVIAAVYLNRVKHDMLLQADPTVQFALGKHVARVYYKDLEIDSPYNTYKYRGLPPGPIASPGRPSIEAALYPASVPYEYFVAFPDGHHEFRADLAGHEKAKLEARRAWDSVEVARRGDSARGK